MLKKRVVSLNAEKRREMSADCVDQELSPEDLRALKNAIETIGKEKGKTFINEHEVLSELKQELVDYEEDIGRFMG